MPFIKIRQRVEVTQTCPTGTKTYQVYHNAYINTACIRSFAQSGDTCAIQLTDGSTEYCQETAEKIMHDIDYAVSNSRG